MKKSGPRTLRAVGGRRGTGSSVRGRYAKLESISGLETPVYFGSGARRASRFALTRERLANALVCTAANIAAPVVPLSDPRLGSRGIRTATTVIQKAARKTNIASPRSREPNIEPDFLRSAKSNK